MPSHYSDDISQKITDALMLAEEREVKARWYLAAFQYSLDENGNCVSTPKKITRSKMYTEGTYNKMIEVINNWGPDKPDTAALKYRKANPKGYDWVKSFYTTQNANGKYNLFHREKDGKADTLVLHQGEMYYDVISQHHRQGHKPGPSLHRELRQQYYNITEKHCILYAEVSTNSVSAMILYNSTHSHHQCNCRQFSSVPLVL